MIDEDIAVVLSCTRLYLLSMYPSLRLLHVVELRDEPSCLLLLGKTSIIGTYAPSWKVILDNCVIATYQGDQVVHSMVALTADQHASYILSGFPSTNERGMRDGSLCLHLVRIQHPNKPLSLVDKHHTRSNFPVYLTRYTRNEAIATTDDFTCIVSVKHGVILLHRLDSSSKLGFPSLTRVSDSVFMSPTLDQVEIAGSTTDAVKVTMSEGERLTCVSGNSISGSLVLASTTRVMAVSLDSGTVSTHMLLPSDGKSSQ